MASAGYVSEGRLLRRHRAAFGFLISISFILILLITVAFGLLCWYMVENRQVTFYITLVTATNVSASHGPYQPFHNTGHDGHKGIGMESDNHVPYPSPEETPSLTIPARGPPAHPSSTAPSPPPPASLPADVTSEQLSAVAESLWDLDTHRLEAGEDLVLDLQRRVGINNTGDMSRASLFQNVRSDIRRLSRVHRRFVRLLDNYDPVVGQPEVETAEESEEVENFLDVITASEKMLMVEDFLRNKGLLVASATLREILQAAWFTPYVRTAVSGRVPEPDSSGFERVFVGEVDGASTAGFHNWIQMYLEERSGRLDYWGYMELAPPAHLSVQFAWSGRPARRTTLLLGTSPDLDLSLYTLCFLARPNAPCPLTIYGRTLTLQVSAAGGGGGDGGAGGHPTVVGDVHIA